MRATIDWDDSVCFYISSIRKQQKGFTIFSILLLALLLRLALGCCNIVLLGWEEWQHRNTRNRERDFQLWIILFYRFHFTGHVLWYSDRNQCFLVVMLWLRVHVLALQHRVSRSNRLESPFSSLALDLILISHRINCICWRAAVRAAQHCPKREWETFSFESWWWGFIVTLKNNTRLNRESFCLGFSSFLW